MDIAYDKLSRIVQLVTVLVAGIYTVWEVPSVWSWTIALVAVVVLGIPHGAADHQIFASLYRDRHSSLSVIKFYLFYVGAIALVGVGWYLLPKVTLTLFFLLSAYHFGQAQLQYLERVKWLNKIIFWCWGAWLLLLPISFQPEVANVILTHLWGDVVTLEISWTTTLSATILLGAGLFAAIKNRTLLFREYLNMLLLIGLFWSTPLLVGFAIYFCCWHALPSALDQIRFFRFAGRQTYSIWDYLLAVLPYTLMAIIGLGVAYWWLVPLWDGGIWEVVFGGIAALTLPHMIILDTMYEALVDGV